MSRTIPAPATHSKPPPIWLLVKKHPIYRFRQAIIVLSIAGSLLCSLAVASPEHIITGSLPFLVLSGIISLADLLSWAMKKIENPDDEPRWPRIFFMVCDIIMSIIMWISFCAMVDLTERRFYSVSPLVSAWASLAALGCWFFHAACFWKQLVARFRNKWLASFVREPCPRCGYHEGTRSTPQTRFGRDDEDGRDGHPCHSEPSTIIPDVAGVFTPQATGSHAEEECLIGSVIGSGYGSVDSPEQTVDQAECTVVSKGKKKATTGARKISLG